jgi:hypothetical protein
MSVQDHVSNLPLETLVVRAIEQRNSAACHEIVRRKINCRPPVSLKTFLGRELFGLSAEAKEVFFDNDDVDLSDEPDQTCILARRMKRDGFTGQNMRESERAAAYIEMAAENPRVEQELPESGRAFWKSADFHYRLWKKTSRGGQHAGA